MPCRGLRSRFVLTGAGAPLGVLAAEPGPISRLVCGRSTADVTKRNHRGGQASESPAANRALSNFFFLSAIASRILMPNREAR
jgi:hypothetical protein